MRDSYSLYEDKLQGEYKETFRKIDMYFWTEQVDDDTREEYMGELLDVFFLAQEEGKPVEKITGKNLESFCRFFCSGLTWQQKVLKVLDQLKGVAWFAFLVSGGTLWFSLGDMAGGEQVNIFEIAPEVNIFGYILGFLISIIISTITDYVTRRLMFKIRRVSMRIWQLIVAVIAAFTFILCVSLYFGDSTFDFPAWIACLISGTYLLLYYIFNKKRLDARKEHKIKFWDEVKKDVDFNISTQQAVAEELEKKWAKKNRKLIKKGRPAMTRAEILDAEEAECLKIENTKWTYYVLPIVICMVVCAVLLAWVEAPREEWEDMLWFYGILLVVEYALMALFGKAARSGLVDRRKWIETERGKLDGREE